MMRIGLYSKSIFVYKGGVERAISSIANAFANEGYEVILYHGEKKYDKPVYVLDPRVATCGIQFLSPSLDEERKHIMHENLDVFYTPLKNNDCLSVISLLHGTGVPLIIAEHGNPESSEKYSPHGFREFCFQYADALHFLCHNFVKSISDELQEKSFVIPNSPFWDDAEPLPSRDEGANIILVMSRLQEFPKQISLLIKAFAQVKDRYPDWKCVICGEGSDRLSYEKMIAAYGLQGKVILTGVVNDVQIYYKEASLFCLPSAFEGLPCAMIEAQCYGIPSVGFARCTGVNEIIRHGENGLLADSFTPESLAACLDHLMGDRELRQRMRCRSLELAQRYSKQSVLAQWRTLLEYAVAKKGHTALDAVSVVGFPIDDKENKSHTRISIQLLRASLKLAREVAMLDNKEARS